jgi:hypothetical protein
MVVSNCLINLQNFHFVILKKENINYIIIYNNNFCCIIKTIKQIKILNNNFIKLNNNLIVVDYLNTFLKQFYLCNFTKIKFTGKGYKIKKNTKQSIILLFNKSHTTTLWWSGIFLKKLKKYKMYLKYNNKQDFTILNTILNIRPINIFTKKGLRSSRQILLKKKGKK